MVKVPFMMSSQSSGQSNTATILCISPTSWGYLVHINSYFNKVSLNFEIISWKVLFTMIIEVSVYSARFLPSQSSLPEMWKLWCHNCLNCYNREQEAYLMYYSWIWHFLSLNMSRISSGCTDVHIHPLHASISPPKEKILYETLVCLSEL